MRTEFAGLFGDEPARTEFAGLFGDPEETGLLDQLVAGMHERLVDFGVKDSLKIAKRSALSQEGQEYYGAGSQGVLGVSGGDIIENRRGIAEPGYNIEQLQASINKTQEHAAKAEEVPLPESSQRLMQSEDFGDAWDAYWSDPINITADLGARSGIAMLPSLALGGAAAAVMGPVGGKFGFAAGMSLGSAGVEYAASITEGLRKEGVDLSDAQSIIDAVSDAELMQRVEKRAMIRAATIGGVAAISGGVATKTFGFGIAGPIKRELANAAVQAVTQAGLGGAGEALAQVATGEELHAGEIAAEAAGEFVTAPLDIGVAVLSGARESKQSQPGFKLREELDRALDEDQSTESPAQAAVRALDPANAQRIMAAGSVDEAIALADASLSQDIAEDTSFIPAEAFTQIGEPVDLAAASIQEPVTQTPEGTVDFESQRYRQELTPLEQQQAQPDAIQYTDNRLKRETYGTEEGMGYVPLPAQELRKKSGDPFSSEKSLKASATWRALSPEQQASYEITPVEGGVVASLREAIQYATGSRRAGAARRYPICRQSPEA